MAVPVCSIDSIPIYMDEVICFNISEPHLRKAETTDFTINEHQMDKFDLINGASYV